jgi:hypothetical protein
MAGSSGATAGLRDSPAGREGQLRCRSSADVFTVSDLITSPMRRPVRWRRLHELTAMVHLCEGLGRCTLSRRAHILAP